MADGGAAFGTLGTMSQVIDRQALDATIEVIRPALQADGGDMEVVDVTDDGVVKVSLTGACGTCPISTSTLKGGIERILKDRFPRR